MQKSDTSKLNVMNLYFMVPVFVFPLNYLLGTITVNVLGIESLSAFVLSACRYFVCSSSMCGLFKT